MAEQAGEMAPAHKAEAAVEAVKVPIRKDIADSAVDRFNADQTAFRSELDSIKDSQAPLYRFLTSIVGGEDKLFYDEFPREKQFTRGALAAYRILSEELGDDMPEISEDLINGFVRSDEEKLGDHTGVEVRVAHGSNQLREDSIVLDNAVEKLDNIRESLPDAKYGAYVVYGLVNQYMGARNINRAVHENLSKL